MNPIERVLDALVEELKKEFPEDRIKAAVDRACDRAEDYFKEGSLMDKFAEAIIASAIRKPFDIPDNDQEQEYPPVTPPSPLPAPESPTEPADVVGNTMTPSD